MTLQIRKRGRPSKQVVQQREAAKPKPRSDAEVLTDLKDRFGMLAKLAQGTIKGDIRSMVVSGAPGVGKTFTVTNVLENAPEAHFEIVKGALSAVNLYKLGYQYRSPGSVIVLDDADSIFTDTDALNILKALCDSSSTRRVHWLRESSALREDEVPQSYEFDGAFCFISNIDFQRYVDEGGNKFVPHFSALMSRSLYLDLRLHDRQSIALWMRHVATEGRLFVREGVTEEIGAKILTFIDKHRNELREMSLRTLVKACNLAKAHPMEWENMARVLLLRG